PVRARARVRAAGAPPRGVRNLGDDPGGEAMSGMSWRFRFGDVIRLVVVWVLCALTLELTALVLPDLSAPTVWSWFAATAIAPVAGLLIRPGLVAVSARIGWIAVVLAGLFGQALILYVSLRLVPGIDETFWSAFIAAWVISLVSLVLSFVLTAGND